MLGFAEGREAEVETNSLICHVIRDALKLSGGPNVFMQLIAYGMNNEINDFYEMSYEKAYSHASIVRASGIRICGRRRGILRSWHYVISIDFEKETTTVALAISSL